MADEDRDFELRARAAFDASVDSLDAATRSRLNQARQRALAARRPGPALPSLGWGVGATAAAALLAVALWTGPGPGPTVQQPATAVAQAEVFDLLATMAEDDLDLLGEDLEFYAWAAAVDDLG
mgnify:FL=1